MAKQATRVQEGTVIDFTADATYANGDIVELNSERIGVALGDAVAGDVIGLAIGDVYKIAAATADDIVVGQAVYWDSANGVITVSSSGTTPAGFAISAKAAGADDTVSVKIG